MANDKRGEIEITVGDKEYLLRPTFNAMCIVERKLGKSMMSLAMDISRISHAEAATIIREFIFLKEGEKLPSIEAVGINIIKEGIIEVIKKMDSIMGLALGGTKGTDDENDTEGNAGPK